MTNPDKWIKFKKTFTQQQEDALWQYFIDHSKLQPNGFFGIMFYVKDINDFWRRVYARFSGEFQRYDKLEKAHKQEMTGYLLNKQNTRRHFAIVQSIQKSKNWKKKIALYLYRKTRDYLFPKF